MNSSNSEEINLLRNPHTFKTTHLRLDILVSLCTMLERLGFGCENLWVPLRLQALIQLRVVF